jgi:DNA helicase HerA-like ATPase
MPISFEEAIELTRAASEKYQELSRLADTVARRLAYEVDGVAVIGRVSILEEVGSDRIPVDVPPHVWVRIAHRRPQVLSPGYYLGVVDPKTLSLALVAVEEAVAASAIARIRVSAQQLVHVDVESRGTPLEAPAYQVVAHRLVVRPLLSVHLGYEVAERIAGSGEPLQLLEGRAVTAPLAPPDPGSPVFIPRPELVEALLSPERGESVAIAALGVMDSPYVVGDRVVPVRLTWRTLVKHVLVTGTTGSGKTSFVKNLVYNALRTGSAEALILDANGDYVASSFPGYVPAELLDEARRTVLRQVYGVSPARDGGLAGPRIPSLIVVPCYAGRGGCSAGTLATLCSDYARRLEQLLEAMYARLGCSVEVGRPALDPDTMICAYEVSVGGDCPLPRTELVVPLAARSIEVGGDARRIAQVDPMLTERARDELRRLHRVCSKDRRIASLDDLYECVAERHGDLRRMGFHRETLNHILRRLYALKSLGFVDVGGTDLDYGELVALLPRIEERYGLRNLRTVILDLEYAVERAPREADPKAVKVVLAAKMISSLIRYAEEVKPPNRYTVVVVDEAHLFFGSRSEEYTSMMVSWLERLARLGRSRGIAMVFSTHREDDVSPAVQTLCNTKVYFRLDERSAEKTPLPSHYRRRLPHFSDHAAVIASYAVRGGYATIVSAPAVVGHRTA